MLFDLEMASGGLRDWRGEFSGQSARRGLKGCARNENYRENKMLLYAFCKFSI
jgi:hypothetical protein